MKVVIGLGNPGEKYLKTRHNIGFMVVDRLVEEYNAGRAKKRFDAAIHECCIEGEKVLFVKPQTFMNLSGESVKKIIMKHGCQPGEVLVVLDDSDLPLGKIRVREQGGSSGHKGLKSVIDCLGNAGFPRLKIGIGGCLSEGKKEFVLSPFKGEEGETIENALNRACKAVVVWLTRGITDCMNMFN